MSQFEPGQRVEADITGQMDILGQGSITPAKILGPGDQPGKYKVQTETQFNGRDLFELGPERLRPLP